jgi:hypothetical protein
MNLYLMFQKPALIVMFDCDGHCRAWSFPIVLLRLVRYHRFSKPLTWPELWTDERSATNAFSLQSFHRNSLHGQAKALCASGRHDDKRSCSLALEMSF